MNLKIFVCQVDDTESENSRRASSIHHCIESPLPAKIHSKNTNLNSNYICGDIFANIQVSLDGNEERLDDSSDKEDRLQKISAFFVSHTL